MRRRLTDESGIALIVALGVTVVISILVVSLVSYTTSNQHAGQLSTNNLQAKHYAEGALNGAYSILLNTNSGGSNASAPNLLGCSGSAAPSDCSNPTPKVFCIAVASGCSAGTAGSASVYGYFSGTNPQPFNGVTVPASSWLLVGTGYASNPNTGGVTAQSETATVKISPLQSGAVGAVWNHVFVTSPLVPNVCSLSFSGNGITINAPLYVMGNLCLGSGGTGASITETTQPVDLQVGGKLVLLGGSKIGTDSLHPITSGVAVGGCTTVSVSSSTTACAPGAFNYWVTTADTFVQNDAPVKTSLQMASDYASFDPGPKHTCQTGTNPAPLAASVFDNDTASNLPNEPNNSASSFELTPNSSYMCNSQSGADVGQLKWDYPNRTLTVNGSIFIDGNMTISTTATYTGTAVIEVAGTVTFNGNSTTLCATGPPCNMASTAWQGLSGNNSMLTLVSLASSTNAITFTQNNEKFQGSLWTQPSSMMTFVQNGVIIQGPMSIGSFDATFNHASLIPLPVINNMPVGAPLPPNAGVTVKPLVYTK